MAEAKAAEPDERAAPSIRRPGRQHVINLCCAQSVHEVVEKVARNLEGLGFRVAVVCGAEARAALLDSRADSSQPTIHVVCVQGSMQERVLKPLRQALATQGGPNHHLFVAVLDVAVPLAMVGQIRRFAEALERAPTPGGPRSKIPSFEQSPTRSYPSLTQVVERGGTKPPASASDGTPDAPRRRARSLSRGRPAKISPTSKYQAVTASHPVASDESGVRKRRRARSRLSPAALRRGPGDRVMGLPAEDGTRRASGPRELPPPLPAPGELARRRSSTSLPAAASPPPPPTKRTPSSTSLAAATGAPKGIETAVTTSHARWPGGQPPADSKPEPSQSEPSQSEPSQAKPSQSESSQPEPQRAADAPERGRIVPRSDSFRFTPPGVKAAENPRPRSGPFTTVPLADVLRDADKTMVHGVLEEVPRTVSTLRLDEPPFPSGPKPKPNTGAGESDEPIEPTMIIAAPTGPKPIPAAPKVEELEAVEEVEATVVGLPPTSAPAAQPSESAKTIVSESSRTLAHAPGEDESLSNGSRTLVLRPQGSRAGPLSSESSGTLVLQPRTSTIEEPLVPAPEQPTARTASTPDDDATAEVSESEKTLLRNDGTFESARDVMDKIAASRQVQVDAQISRATPKKPSVTEEPEGPAAPQETFKPGKTVLYAESTKAPTSSSGTVVAAVPTRGSATANPIEKIEKTEEIEQAEQAEAVEKTEEIEPAAPQLVASDRSQRRPPSAIPTERHAPLPAKAKPSRRSRSRNEGPKPTQTEDPSRAAKVRERPRPERASKVVVAAPSTPPDQARRPKRSSYGWLWILLVLLTGGAGVGAYQAGLLDGVLGRSTTNDSTIAKTDPPPPAEPTPTPALTTTLPDTSPSDETGPATDEGPAPAAATTGSPPSDDTDASTGNEPDDTSTGNEPDDTSTGIGNEPDATDSGSTSGGDEPATPEASTAGSTDSPPDEPQLSPEEAQLAAAVDDRRVYMLKSLFTTRRQGTATSWRGGWQRCAKLEIDGVKGWRLPHRREMKLINAVLSLSSGLYWTRTVPDEDKAAAYVLDTSNGALSLFLKQEPTGEVVCVRPREYPDK